MKHPVFHFDMSTAKHMNEEQLLEELNEKLHTYELVFGRGETEKNINQRLAGIVRRSVEQTGAEAVIIIDEYDAPLLDVMNDRERLIPMRQIMRNFRTYPCFLSSPRSAGSPNRNLSVFSLSR